MQCHATCCTLCCTVNKAYILNFCNVAHLLMQCRRYLHVVLCMSPIGAAFRERLRQNPSLVNCCTIDW
jgi:hypothetical protein